jgi:hypothetical protein
MPGQRVGSIDETHHRGGTGLCCDGGNHQDGNDPPCGYPGN